jgi:hypothetical protein
LNICNVTVAITETAMKLMTISRSIISMTIINEVIVACVTPAKHLTKHYALIAIVISG